MSPYKTPGSLLMAHSVQRIGWRLLKLNANGDLLTQQIMGNQALCIGRQQIGGKLAAVHSP